MDNLPQQVVKELEARGAAPKPRWYFVLMRTLFWLLSLTSIAIGGIALSVGWYVFFDNDGLHVTLANLFQVIPYVWVFVLCLFLVCAYLGFRQTRKGYKYAAGWVLAGVLGASIGLALLFDHFDFGQSIHKYLLSHTDFYDALIYSSEDGQD